MAQMENCGKYIGWTEINTYLLTIICNKIKYLLRNKRDISNTNTF